MTYKLSWKIIEMKIAEPEKTIAKYSVYYQWLSFLICNFLVFLLDKWSYLTTEFLFVIWLHSTRLIKHVLYWIIVIFKPWIFTKPHMVSCNLYHAIYVSRNCHWKPIHMIYLVVHNSCHNHWFVNRLCGFIKTVKKELYATNCTMWVGLKGGFIVFICNWLLIREVHCFYWITSTPGTNKWR